MTMLTEPVQCASCKAVSVNGGTLHCHGCYEATKKDAERYRKIKDKYSSFLVRDVHRHELGHYFVSPELDEALDAWTEDGGGLSEWNNPLIDRHSSEEKR